MKIKYRLFHRWWVKWLLKQKSSPHKYKGETDYVRSQCLVAILKKIEPDYIRLSQLNYKFRIKTIHNSRSRIIRDEQGKETVNPDPVFSINQSAGLKSKWWSTLILLVLFGLAEAALYILTASTFMPGLPEYCQVIVGAVLSIVFMYTLAYSFSIKEKYLKARDQTKENKTPEHEIKWLKYKYQYTVPFIIGCIVAMVAAGVSRIYYFDNLDKRGLSEAVYHSKFISSKLASIAVLIFTVMGSIFVGFKKNEFDKINTDFLHYSAWNRGNTKRNNYTQEFLKYVEVILNVVDKYTEEYWMVVIEIKRVFNMAEYDQKYDALHAEYWNLRCQPNFVVTDDIYRKFSVIQSAYEELFRYGVKNDAVIMSKIKRIAELCGVPVEHLAEHIKALSEAIKEKHIAPTFSSNGNSKNEIKFTNLNQNGMNLTTLLVAFLATTLLFSCNTKVPRPPKNIVISGDMSGSRDNPTIKWYEGVISNSVIDHLGTKDRFIVLPIDSGSVQAGQEIMITDFGTNDYKNATAGQYEEQAEMNIHRDSLLAVQQRFIRLFDSAVYERKSLDGGTDIVGSIEQAKKYALPGHDNIMIIFSDMLVYANYGNGLIDFETDLTDTTQIAGYLAKTPQIDLKGWTVLIATGSQPNISTSQFSAVEKFWNKWFSACHANLKIYTSGSVSLIEKELEQ